MTPADSDIICDILDRNRIGIIRLYITLCLLHISHLRVPVLAFVLRIVHQHGKEAVQFTGHGNTCLICISLRQIDSLQSFPYLILRNTPLQYIGRLSGKISIPYNRRGICSHKSCPSVFPGFFPVCMVLQFYSREQHERITGA